MEAFRESLARRPSHGLRGLNRDTGRMSGTGSDARPQRLRPRPKKRLRMIWLALLLCTVLPLAACTAEVKGPKVEVTPPKIEIGPAEPNRDFCPPGQAKKGNC